MSFDCTPSIVIAAFFAAIVSMDLFRHDYKNVPVHVMEGLFFTILMSMLCQQQRYLLAWVLMLVPFVWIIGGIVMRNLSMQLGAANTTFLQRAYHVPVTA